MVVKMIETEDNNCVTTFMNVRNFEIFGHSLILDFEDGKSVSLPRDDYCVVWCMER